MRKWWILCLSGVMLCVQGFSQDRFSRIKKETNQAALKRLAIEYSQEAKKAYDQAEEKALQEGWPIREESENGVVIQLRRLTPTGQPEYYITNNTVSAQSISTDKIQPSGISGYDLTGANFLIGEWDAGEVRTSHEQLNGRVVMGDASTGLNSHATHVCGTMIGNGSGNVSARGMAPLASVEAYNFSNDNAEIASNAHKFLVSNHSYGSVAGWYKANNGNWHWYGNLAVDSQESYLFGQYNYDSRAWDNIAYNAPYYLMVKSAGNDRQQGPPPNGEPYQIFFDGGAHTFPIPQDGGEDGYDCIPTYGVAKNIMTVGAVEDIPGGYEIPSDVVATSFTSYGPADDGRIKPDIVANGRTLLSSGGSADNSYMYMSGTSMSAPSVTGSAILLQEMYEKVHGVGNFMLASTLKGLILHTADEAGSGEGPDYKFGWGLMNSYRAAQLIEKDELIVETISEQVLSTGETYEITVVPTSTEPLVATLCWTDPAGSADYTTHDNSNPKLINDLDLRIVNASETYFPYVLDPLNPDLPATKGDNVRDNVEKVYIENPSCAYTIIVSHKGLLSSGQQTFSLIISGIEPSSTLDYDAGIMEISDLEANSCNNLIQPGIALKNFGTELLTNVAFSYQINNEPIEQYTWTGNLEGACCETIDLPSFFASTGNNQSFKVWINTMNGQLDQNTSNDTITSFFDVDPSLVSSDIPYEETFQNGMNAWENTDLDGFGSWKIYSNTSCNHQKAMYFDNYNEGIFEEEDYVVSPYIDLTESIAPSLYFDVAYSPRSVAAYETLSVEISANCGTYTEVYSKSNQALKTNQASNYSTAHWLPTTCDDWRTETIDLSSFVGQTIQIRFVNHSRSGNSLMIDDVQITDIPACNITNVEVGAQSECDINTNTYSQELILRYNNPPPSGMISVNNQLFPIASSPQSIILQDLPSNGLPVDIYTFFTEDTFCDRMENDLFIAPETCSFPKCIWIGAGNDNDWNNPANWVGECGLTGFPVECEGNAYIAGGMNGYPIIDEVVGTNGLYIDEQASIQVLNSGKVMVCEHLTNLGDSDLGSGELVFTGVENQLIEGSVEIAKMRNDNPDMLTLESEAELVVRQYLFLNDGSLDATNGQIILRSDANQTAYLDDFSSSGTIVSGSKVEVEQYLENESGYPQKVHIAPAATGQNIESFVEGNELFLSAEEPDGTQATSNAMCSGINEESTGRALYDFREQAISSCFVEGWHIRNAGDMDNGKGYLLRVDSSTVLSTSGEVVSGTTIVAGLTNLSPQTNNNFPGLNLIGNPYPSPIDWNAVAAHNINTDGTAYMYESSGDWAGTYQPYNLLYPTLISSSEAFFVRILDGSSMAFDNTMRRTNEQIPTADSIAGSYELNIEVKGNGHRDKTKLCFSSSFYTTFDTQYDAMKITSSSGQPTLYTENWVNRQSINALPGVEEISAPQTIPLGLNPGASGAFEFLFDGMDDFPQKTLIFLEDKVTGAIVSLRSQETYSFSSNKNDNPDRFILHFLPSPEISVNDETCQGQDASIFIRTDNQNIGAHTIEWTSATLRDAAGNILQYNAPVSDAELFSGLSGGDYAIALTHEGYTMDFSAQIDSATLVIASYMHAPFIFPGSTTSFTNSSQGAENYSWDFGDGSASTVSSPNHIFYEEGYYEVVLMAENQNCSDTLAKTIVVGNITSIHSLSEQGVQVFGYQDVVYIKSQSIHTVKQVDLFNLLGQHIYTNKNIETDEQINMNQQIDGYYIIRIQTEEEVYTSKIYIGK